MNSSSSQFNNVVLPIRGKKKQTNANSNDKDFI